MLDEHTKIETVLNIYYRDRTAMTGERQLAPAGHKYLKQHALWLRHSIGHITLDELRRDPTGVMTAHFERRRKGKIFWKEGGELRGGETNPAEPTLRHDMTNLKAALKHCSEKPHDHPERISKDCVPNFKDVMPKGATPNARWLSRDEGRRLLMAAQPPVAERLTRAYRAIVVMLYCGPRKEAMENLTWDRIVITEKFDPTLRRNVRTGYLDFNEPGRQATKKRRAVVAISHELMPIIERAQAERLVRGDGTLNPWFLDSNKNLRRTIETAYKYAGLEDVSRMNHILRTTFATWAVQDGVPLTMVAEALNDTVEMVEKHYAKHAPNYQHEVMTRNTLGLFASQDALDSNQQVSAGIHTNVMRRRVG